MSRVDGENAGAARAGHLLGLATSLGSADTAADALEQLVHAGCSSIVGASDAAVLRFGNEVTTLAAGSTLASLLADLERQFGPGPARSAALGAAPLYVDDLRADQAWARFSATASQEHGVLSMLCCPVPDGATEKAALVLLATKPNAFDDDDVATACSLAGYAALALTVFHAREQAAGLQVALKNSREIGIAMGILMNRHLVTRDDAFAMLVAASQNTHRKLRAVAVEVADSGMLEVPPGWNRLRGASGQPVTSAHVRVRGEVAVVIATGEFDMATAHLLGAALEEARDLKLPVRLDMSAVSFVDASALDVIVTAQRELAERNCPFTILRPAASVLNSLRLAGLTVPVRTGSSTEHRGRG
jgi:anti-anti-sigma factor